MSNEITASDDSFAMRFDREEWGVIVDALIQHRAHADDRKRGNSESTSDVRASMCADIITRVGQQAGHIPLTGCGDHDPVRRTEIGYVCSRGHYLFTADSEEIASCGSKRVASITVNWEVSDDDIYHEKGELLDECQDSLGRIIKEWRQS